MMKMYVAALLLLLSLLANAQAQDASVAVQVDSTDYLIGEWITVRLIIDAPADWTLRLPSKDDDFANAEFVSAEEAVRDIADGRQSLRQNCVITVFDTGRTPVRAIVRYSLPDDTTKYELTSDALTLNITTVELDTTQSFKDIRDVLHIPLSIWDYLLYIGLALLIVLLGWFGYRWYSNREEPEEEAAPEPVPDLPAHVLALKELEEIRLKQLWQHGKHKLYQSRVTDVLRAYIEQRFQVAALEHPTSEIIPEVAMLGLQPTQVSDLEQVLRTADLTKFAKYVPNNPENERAMSFSVAFVEDTKIEDIRRADPDDASDSVGAEEDKGGEANV